MKQFLLLTGIVCLPFSCIWAQYEIGVIFQATVTIEDDDSALPLRWLSFTGQLTGNQTQLQWIVAAERDLESYVVEWSTDARHWSKIDNQEPIGGASNRRTYASSHAAPLLGLNYYRVSALESTGSVTYSDVVIVEYSDDRTDWSRLLVYPNPSLDGTVRLQFPTRFVQDAEVEIRIRDTQGRLVYRMYIQPDDEIRLANLATGTYRIVASQNGQYAQTTWIRIAE